MEKNENKKLDKVYDQNQKGKERKGKEGEGKGGEGREGEGRGVKRRERRKRRERGKPEKWLYGKAHKLKHTNSISRDFYRVFIYTSTKSSQATVYDTSLGRLSLQ